MAIFRTKPSVNPFGKMSILRLFKPLVLTGQKVVFFALEYRKRHFPGLYCLKKKVGKMAIFGPKPGFNPFGKISIFRLFELAVFIAQNSRFFALEYCKRIFPGLYWLKKMLEKWQFFDQNYGLTPLTNVNFSTFQSPSFYCLESRFFALEYSKRHFLVYFAE